MKQPNGHGSVYQRGDSRWCAAITIDLVGGKPRRRVFYGRTRKEVTRKLRDAQALKQQGVHLDREKTTVAQVVNQWLDDVVARKDSQNTLRSYRSQATIHVIPVLGHIPVIKLEADDVQRMINTCLDNGMSAQSVAHLRSEMRVVLNFAKRRGLVASNVAMDVVIPPIHAYEAQTLTPVGAGRFLDAARGDTFEALYCMAVYLGMRQGEMLGLRWQDIDREAGRLRIRKALLANGGALVLSEPKTKGSKRTLPLPVVMVTMLRAHRARQHAQRLRRGARWTDLDLVFCTGNGRPLTGSRIRTQFKALLERAGLPPMRFHDLRHSCATFLAMAGVPVRVAMEILGHTNMRTTQMVYTHVQDGGKESAIDALDRLLDRPREAS